jgi:hypothetical protein
MIVLAFAAAALAQPLWTGPRTVEYVGPGNFCGGGYRVALGPGERALVLPQGQAPQATRFVFSAGEVNVQSGARPQPGPVVRRYGGTVVTQASDGDGITYIVSDDTGFGLRVTSSAFHGPKSDRWFFNKANFADHADEGANCLAGRSN